MPDRYDPDRVAADLSDCRRRGLNGLDVKTSNQDPVHAGELQRLAEALAAVRGLKDSGRILQIKALLIVGIEDLREQNRQAEADLIRDLFFGESTDGPIGSPGHLLDIARGRAVSMIKSRFDDWRKTALRSFAEVLVAHVTGLTADDVESPIPDSKGQIVTIGSAGDIRHFAQLMASAEKVTIVGITNADLLPMLKAALRLKGETTGRADSFWDSLRIVFLSIDLLGTVSDERLRLSDPAEALRQRREAAIWARRLIGVFLKRCGPTSWSMFESNYNLALTGTFLEFTGGGKIAHLLIRRPQHATVEQLYLDIPDPESQIGAVFDEIVYTSKSDDMIVPVGEPAHGHGFRCYETREQSEVLTDDSRAGGWLPMVLLVTYRNYRGHADPILQLRTVENSAREENRLSHVAGYVLESDRRRPGGRQLALPASTFDLRHEVPVSAAQRIFWETAGGREPTEELIPVTASGYLYPDKESLFFFVYALSVPEGLEFPKWAEMRPFGLRELLTARANQTFASAAELCRARVSAASWAAAVSVAAPNLTLHDQPDLAEKLLAMRHDSPADRAEVALALDGLVSDLTVLSRAANSRQVRLEGLAGWQYRYFFSDLLPLYDRIGVDGATGLLESLTEDSAKNSACRQLADLYQNESLMSLLPMEL